MVKDNHEAAQSALDHIESIERKLKMLKQIFNPQTGTVTDSQLMAGLINAIDDEINDLTIDSVRLL